MQFPQAFKQELKEYVGQLNPTENNQEFLDRHYHMAARESKAAPSGLRSMMTNSNANGSEGTASRASRADPLRNDRRNSQVHRSELVQKLKKEQSQKTLKQGSKRKLNSPSAQNDNTLQRDSGYNFDRDSQYNSALPKMQK